MKRDFDHLNLRRAFRDEPAMCHQALMDAVRSVKVEETKPMKRNTHRALLIAAIILVSTLTVAFAASELFGLNHYFWVWGIYPTDKTQTAMKPDQETVIEVGPLTFTVQERIADPHTAMLSTRFAVTDGTRALIHMFPEDVILPEHLIGYVGGTHAAAALAERIGLDAYARVTWGEAAQQLGVPLYQVRVRLEPAPEQDYGLCREDIMWDGDGSSGVFISHCDLHRVAAGSEITVTLAIDVAQVSPDTGEMMGAWSERLAYRMPISELLAHRVYLPEGLGYQPSEHAALTKLTVEMYSTGMYVHHTYQMAEGADLKAKYPVDKWMDAAPLMDATGATFASGISLGGSYDTIPNVVGGIATLPATQMINVTELPDAFRVGGVLYTLTAE